jgi:hypothetical protein
MNNQKRKSIHWRLTSGTKSNGVLSGSIIQMVKRIEEDSPGAGHWLLDQVPKGSKIVDVLYGFVIDAFFEEGNVVEKPVELDGKVRGK